MRKAIVTTFLTIFFFCTAVLSPLATASAAYEPGGTLYSQTAYLVNLDSGTVVYSKNENQKAYPASLTKIMTVMLVLETETDLQKKLTMSHAVRDELYGTGASTIALEPGEEITVEDLLYACMVPSACDAAAVLAEYYGGGNQAAFVEKMNAKAKELGAVNTHFVNSHGLHDDNQYTTAYDMYLITKAALDVPGFEKIATTVRYTFKATNKHPEERTYSHTNLMINQAIGGSYYYPYAKGIKTGTTDESGKNLVTMASKDGFNYLLVTTGAPLQVEGVRDNYAIYDHRMLYKWAFDTFSFKTVLKTAEAIETIKVRLSSDTDTLQLRPKEDITLLLPNDVDLSSIQQIIDIPESVDAPVEVGDVIGTVELKLNNETIGKCDLVANMSVSKNFIYGIWDTVSNALSSTWAKIAIAAVAVMIVLYLAIAVAFNRKKKRNRRLSVSKQKKKGGRR
ncbi:MAG: D-alanyl-D-alanine carboxypeptidase [Oscillospiraceae bacterium]|nr:D-alanyl-D-alanine carboxypeptidase [Oscillospiraceae bacterium]